MTGFGCIGLLVEAPTRDGTDAWAAYCPELDLTVGGRTAEEALERLKAACAETVRADWDAGEEPLNRYAGPPGEPLRGAYEDGWASGHRGERVPYNGGWLVHFDVCEDA